METENQSLPPRSEVHKSKQPKKKFKLKYPVIRLLALFFILLPITILSYTFNANKEKSESSPSKSNTAFESIDYENKSNISPEDKLLENQKIVEDTKENSKEDAKENTSTDEATNTSLPNVNQETEPNNSVEPEPKKSTEPAKITQEKPKDIYEIKYHKVKKNETLFSISIKYYKSRDGEALLKKWNNLNGNTVYVGQTLKIPIKITNQK